MTSAFDPSEYGRNVADVYDEVYEGLSAAAAVECIARYAEGGAVLEFGIGSGRLALPLAGRGLAVEGIEGSPEMVERLRGKPGGAALRVEIGDFTTTTTGRRYRVTVLAFNTINALPTQDAQVATFANAAAHLEDGGAFLVENWVPDPAALLRGQSLRVHEVSDRQVIVEVIRLHAADQRMTTAKLAFSDGGVRLLPANHRYVWPGELDLMARMAGLRLEERFEDWSGRPFTDASETYVAVYRKDA